MLIAPALTTSTVWDNISHAVSIFNSRTHSFKYVDINRTNGLLHSLYITSYPQCRDMIHFYWTICDWMIRKRIAQKLRQHRLSIKPHRTEQIHLHLTISIHSLVSGPIFGQSSVSVQVSIAIFSHALEKIFDDIIMTIKNYSVYSQSILVHVLSIKCGCEICIFCWIYICRIEIGCYVLGMSI